jgi:pimeloyl-ACP methyl ester carboxylesterase
LSEPGETRRSPRRRLRRALIWTGSALAALVVIAVVGVLVYANVGVMAAEAAPLQAVRDDPAIVLDESGASIVMTPATGASGAGLVFIPGAKVDPLAYAAKLSGLVHDDGLTVVITRPTLNLAFFDLRPLSAFTDAAPEVKTWFVGGHSLGGVKACQLATDAAGLVLFASYCANDLSSSGLPVLSIAGAEDGLSTPQKIADARHLLPADADLVEIAGASHASFGDYGPQPGDGTPTITDADMTAQLARLVGGFIPAG